MSQQVTRLVTKAPHLTWLKGGEVHGVTPLTRSVVVGREPNRCDVTLESDLVSRQHARIVPADAGHVELIDLNSSNGTFVNGRRVAVVRLSDGDRIGFGSAEEAHCVFRAAPPAPANVRGVGPEGCEAATATLSGELRRCPECSRVMISGSGVCRYCSADSLRHSGDTAEAGGRGSCGSCGTPAREGGSFCHRCGARLTG